MRLLAPVFFAFGGSLFLSSGYYRLHYGERVPPKGWFRFCNEMLRRRRYDDDPGPVSEFPPPRLSIAAGVLLVVAGISLQFGHWAS